LWKIIYMITLYVMYGVCHLLFNFFFDGSATANLDECSLTFRDLLTLPSSTCILNQLHIYENILQYNFTIQFYNAILDKMNFLFHVQVTNLCFNFNSGPRANCPFCPSVWTLLPYCFYKYFNFYYDLNFSIN
jgi:hypothetical protein